MLMKSGSPVRNLATCLLSLAVLVGAIPGHAACEMTDVEVTIVKSSWFNRCSKRNCAELKGTALLTSRCDELIGVRVRLNGLDEAGKVIAQREAWPWDLSRVARGEHSFSLDKWLKHDAAIRHFSMEVTDLRVLADTP